MKPFYADCVNWPRDRIAVLTFLLSNKKEISRRLFLKNTEAHPEEFPKDEYIDYYRYGDIFWARFSGIEQVYANDGDIEVILRGLESGELE